MGCPGNPAVVLYDEDGNFLGIPDGSGKSVVAVGSVPIEALLESILGELKIMNRHLNDITELYDDSEEG